MMEKRSTGDKEEVSSGCSREMPTPKNFMLLPTAGNANLLSSLLSRIMARLLRRVPFER
jgi:hypothetical protein